MIVSPAMLVINTFNKTNHMMLGFLKKLTNEQLHFRLHAEHHPIAFHAWHVGRWTDHFQASVPGMTHELSRRLPPGAQIWETEGVAEHWGFNSADLGFASTGMNMPDELALRLQFPPKDILLEYVERAFTLAQKAVAAIDDVQFQTAEEFQPLTSGIWGESTVGDAVIAHLTHNNRHLGMMECLLGLQGQSGTATQ
jgi:hypothetical protein